MTLSPAERFEIRGPLGEGAMGVVFEAYDLQEQVAVALKTVRTFEPEAALFLRREFRAIRGIRHPNLVQLYELVADGGECFFTMERVYGEDLFEAVRGSAAEGQAPELPLDEACALFLQVAEGLAAIHAAERLHRDVKPTNVLVTAEGRAVILDFGLAHVFAPGAMVSAPDGMSGTIHYVSPEQAFQAGIGPATDWYSFGVMLYEAISGRLPLGGLRASQHILALRDRVPAPLDEVLPDLPPSLVDLVARLLLRDPTERAGYADVVAVLGELAGARRVPAAPVSTRLPFVGRRAQLDALLSAWTDVRSGAPPAGLVFLSGPSGMGKSEVLRRFIRRVEAERRVIVLQGRCQPKENVPFKAFDAVVDELTLYLERQEASVVERIVPEDAGGLLRIFPALEQVRAFEPYRDAALPAEPQELRRRGYRAFRGLLKGLTSDEPLLLHIDDLQWGDLDSVQLLAALLRGPSPPRVLVVVAHRSEDSDSSPALRALRALADGELASITRTIEVGPLSRSDVAELAGRLATRPGGPPPIDVDAVVEQTAGSPFFVGELIRWRAAQGDGPDAPLSVADIIRARVARLAPVERRVLETVALAGHPLDPHLALRASGLGAGGGDILYDLDETFLRRVSGGAGLDAVEPLHDRIREVVAGDVGEGERAARHLALAEEIRATEDPDPLHLMEHYRQGGNLDEAARFGEDAAARAESALAFSLAADVYRAVIELRGGRVEWGLRARHAEALKNAGRGVEAADVYLVAAEGAAAAGVEDDARRWRQAAAEQLLHNGRIDRGMELLAAELGRIGASAAPSPIPATLLASGLRLRLWWRGLAFEARDPAELPVETRARLDTLWGAAMSMSMFSHSRADPLGVAHLLEALDAGDVARVHRALRYEAAFQVGFLGSPLGSALSKIGVLDLVPRLPEPEDSPYDRAWAHLCESAVAWFQADWRRCAREGEEGIRVFRAECRGAHFEVTVIQLFRLAALVFLGEVATVRAIVEEELRAALARGDAFAANVYRLGEPLSAWLYADRPEDAVRVADEAIAAWPSKHFDTQNYHHLLGRAQALLYLGRPWDGMEGLEAGWGALDRSFLLLYRAIEAEMLHLRARLALAAAASRAPPPPALRKWSRPKLLKRARNDAARIARLTELGWSQPLSESLLGGVAALEGDVPRARRHLAAAAVGFEREGMRVMEQAMWHRVASLGDGPVPVPGGEPRLPPSCERVEATLEAWGVVAPTRLVAMLAPIGPPPLALGLDEGVAVRAHAGIASAHAPLQQGAPPPPSGG